LHDQATAFGIQEKRVRGTKQFVLLLKKPILTCKDIPFWRTKQIVLYHEVCVDKMQGSMFQMTRKGFSQDNRSILVKRKIYATSKNTCCVYPLPIQ
jgi:hypothetical protein